MRKDPDTLPCDFCKKIKPETAWAIDPYELEVNGNEVEIWVCDDCFDQRKGEI